MLPKDECSTHPYKRTQVHDSGRDTIQCSQHRLHRTLPRRHTRACHRRLIFKMDIAVPLQGQYGGVSMPLSSRTLRSFRFTQPYPFHTSLTSSLRSFYLRLEHRTTSPWPLQRRRTPLWSGSTRRLTASYARLCSRHSRWTSTSSAFHSSNGS